MTPRSILPLTLGLLLLPACASSSAVKGAASTPVAARTSTAVQPAAPARTTSPIEPPRARVLSAPGLEGVIGAGADDLVRQFGPARLDVWEGDARKLQFGGPACVLDIYLYPAAAGREPRATYVDARRASDGKDVDRAACVTALKAKRG